MPLDAVSVAPTWAVPLMLGMTVFTGAASAAMTTAVWAEDAVELPDPFKPFTATRIVEPTSAPDCTYVVAVSPPMLTQLLPDESQRSH